eukprot:sb/3468602/
MEGEIYIVAKFKSRFKLPHPQSSLPAELHVPSSVLNRSVEAVIERSNVQITRIMSREVLSELEEPTDTSKQPIRTLYSGHVTGYQPIRDQYFLIRSVSSLHIIIEVKVVQVHDSALYEALEHGHESGNERLQVVDWLAAQLELMFVSSCRLNYLQGEGVMVGIPAGRGRELDKCHGGSIVLFKPRAWGLRGSNKKMITTLCSLHIILVTGPISLANTITLCAIMYLIANCSECYEPLKPCQFRLYNVSIVYFVF